MTLYGYSREPDPAAADEPVSRVPQPRVASEPVSVPGAADPDPTRPNQGEDLWNVESPWAPSAAYTPDESTSYSYVEDRSSTPDAYPAAPVSYGQSAPSGYGSTDGTPEPDPYRASDGYPDTYSAGGGASDPYPGYSDGSSASDTSFDPYPGGYSATDAAPASSYESPSRFDAPRVEPLPTRVPFATAPDVTAPPFGTPSADLPPFGTPPVDASPYGSAPPDRPAYGSPPAERPGYGAPPVDPAAYRSSPAESLWAPGGEASGPAPVSAAPMSPAPMSPAPMNPAPPRSAAPVPDLPTRNAAPVSDLPAWAAFASPAAPAAPASEESPVDPERALLEPGARPGTRGHSILPGHVADTGERTLPAGTVYRPATLGAAPRTPEPNPEERSSGSLATSPSAEGAVWAAAADVDLDGPVVVPWDRRPLMVVIAAGAALVLLAIVSGIVASSMYTPTGPAAWQAPQGLTSGPPPSGAPAGGPPTGETITLSGVGDVIMGTEPNKLPPAGGAGFFDPVKSALAADVVMGNLETPLTANTGTTKCTSTASATAGAPPCYQLYLPPSYANHLRSAGFGVVSLANYHTNDMGAKGLTNTRTALEAAGVKHTGAPNQITYVDVKGFKVAVLGFAAYSWGQSLTNISAAAELVRKADQAADLVVIQMQGGAEGPDRVHVKPGTETYLGENRGDLMKFSRAVIDAGADVVFGHGPHVMRGMEFYKGRLIAYSLGNFCGYGMLGITGSQAVGGVLKVTLAKDGSWVRGQLVPTAMVKGGLPAPDADKRALAFVNGLSKDDFGAAAAQISTDDGTIAPPATS